MNINLIVLKYLLTKKHYLQYRKYIVYKDHKELKILYELLDLLYEKHDVESFSLDEYISFVKVHTDDDVVALLLDQLAAASVGDGVLADLVDEIYKRAKAMEIAMLAIEVNEGKKDFTFLMDVLKSPDEVVVEEDIFVSDDLEVLYDNNVKKPGLRWRLKTLNEMLGSLRQGDFGFVFARPETGKTTFLASEVSFFAEQVVQPILWFNNEEQGDKVSIRCIQGALGITQTELFANRTQCAQQYAALTHRNIKIIDRASIHRRDVEKICEQYKPSLIIFDQIDKIKGFDADREDLRLGAIYIWARELAKKHAPVIGVCQADGTAEGKQWLTMENVANAKTSKQAEADWILGIGKKNEPGYDLVRYLHLSKNKLTGDEDTIPELRHGRRDVLIDAERARYKDI